MATFESSVTIDRPPAAVFAWFMALDEHAPRTDPEADSGSKEPPGDTGPGTVFTLRSGSRTSQIRYDSVDNEALIGFSMKLGPMRPEAEISFEPSGTGTRVHMVGRSNPIGPLRIFEALANRRGKREWDGRLERIKADLEAG